MKKYDFALTWVNSEEERFVQWLKRECKLRNLDMLVAGPGNIRSAVKDVEEGRMRIKFLLDNEAAYNEPIDIYARFCYAVKDTGGLVVCDPD